MTIVTLLGWDASSSFQEMVKFSWNFALIHSFPWVVRVDCENQESSVQLRTQHFNLVRAQTCTHDNCWYFLTRLLYIQDGKQLLGTTGTFARQMIESCEGDGRELKKRNKKIIASKEIKLIWANNRRKFLTNLKYSHWSLYGPTEVFFSNTSCWYLRLSTKIWPKLQTEQNHTCIMKKIMIVA